MFGNGVENDVVADVLSGKILLPVVDHLSAPRSCTNTAFAAANPGHLGPEDLGDLDREMSYPVRRRR